MTSDHDLLQQWQAGDSSSGGVLFRRHYDAVTRFLRNKVDDSARDDLVQQTFLSAQTARFEGRSAVRTWLLAIAWRKTADYYRKRGRDGRNTQDFGEQSVVDMGECIHNRLQLQAEQRLLLEGLRRLPLQ
ncbi:MAG: DNA-directed RNA polymerase specialized sigma24 family protein, partial [Myxococcota bacterium]